MPSRFRRTGRRRSYRIRRRRARGTRRLMSRVARRTIYRMAEKKFNIVLIAVTQRTTPNTFSFDNLISQGVGAGQFVGQQIRVKRYTYRLYFNFVTGAGGNVDGTVRVSVVFPRKNVDFDQITAISPGITNQWNPQLVYVLSDRTFSLSGSNADSSGGNPTEKVLTWSRPLHQIINYNSLIASGRRPMLYITSSVPDGNASNILVAGSTRMSYIDA